MASGKRMDNETFSQYRQRLWCKEKAYRLYIRRLSGDMSFDGYVKKFMDMFNGVQDESE
jgi:hypothetical protein